MADESQRCVGEPHATSVPFEHRLTDLLLELRQLL
jgi:hypothetical protein